MSHIPYNTQTGPGAGRAAMQSMSQAQTTHSANSSRLRGLKAPGILNSHI